MKNQKLRDWAPWLLGLFLALLIFGVGKQLVRRYSIMSEYRSLKEQSAAIAQKNSDLAKLLSYVNTNAYTEEQARLRFGLGEAGERLAIIPDSEKPQDISVGSTNQINNPEKIANYKKWWQLFFH